MRMRQGPAAALALAVFVVAALVATYPLILRPSHAIAGGLGDPLLNATVLAWDADRAKHGFQGFWDIPFLFPHRHTLAYAEPLLGVALFTTPIEWVSGNPVLVYNVAYIGSYVLAGFGMFPPDARSVGPHGCGDPRRPRLCAHALPAGADDAPAGADERLDAHRPVGAAPLFRRRLPAMDGGLRRGVRGARTLERLLPLLLLLLRRRRRGRRDGAAGSGRAAGSCSTSRWLAWRLGRRLRRLRSCTTGCSATWVSPAHQTN